MEDRHLMPTYMDGHVQEGGIPEFVLTRDVRYLNAMIESILFRELMERSRIRNWDTLIDILKMIARNVGSPLSKRNIARTLGISVNTVSNVISLLREANLIKTIERSGKFRERRASPPKIYLTDNGMFNVLVEKVNKRILAENMVLNHLFKKETPNYVSSKGREVDLRLGEDLYEVKYKDEIDERDRRNLERTDSNGMKVIITRSKEGDGEIDLVSRWKFPLERMEG